VISGFIWTKWDINEPKMGTGGVCLKVLYELSGI